MGDEALHATIVNVPTVVKAYNLFMNGVDRFDQLRASHMTARRENQISMPVFTFLLDASVQNGYAMNRSIKKPQTDTMTLKESERRVAEAMVAPIFSLQAQRKSLVFVTRSTDLARCGRLLCGSDTEKDEGADNGSSVHSQLNETTRKKLQMLLPTIGYICVRCYIRTVRNVSKAEMWIHYACHSYSLAFHVEYYAAYHYGLEIKRHNSGAHADIRHITQRIRMATSLRSQ